MGLDSFLFPLLTCIGVLLLLVAIVVAVVLFVKKKIVIGLLVGIPLLCIGCSVISVGVYIWSDSEEYELEDYGGNDFVDFDFDLGDDGGDWDDTEVAEDSEDSAFGDDASAEDSLGDGFVRNDEYNFQVHVGDYDDGVWAGYDLEGTVETLSFCAPTSETNSAMGECDEGYFPIFDITVMTWEQWADHISDESIIYDMYTKIGDDADNVYLFSHPNGDYPSDIDVSGDYFDAVIVSFETDE